MRIHTDFPGANIEVYEKNEGIVKVRPQLRDTTTDWFYWAFCVEGAQGQTWTFDFSGKNYIGYFGPAVSRDLEDWHWAGSETLDGYSRFTYHFGPEEKRVYFAHNMVYLPERFYRFAEVYNIPIKTLVNSEKGNPVDIAEFGEGDAYIVLTSRHHACESTGTYVMEGMLKEFYTRPVKGLKVLAVPFIDIDGVINGDQGKNRYPHDHNRDYLPNPIYRSTAELMEYTKDKNVKYMLDLHSPWHFGGRNDTCFVVHAIEGMKEKYNRFGKILEEITGKDPGSMQYCKDNNIDINVEWNVGGTPTCSRYFGVKPGIEMSFTFETAYFGTADNMVSQDRLIRLGENLARAVKAFNDLQGR
ncbi:MAG: hypothetical protein GX854_13430 [Clostridiales bacterium]|jgi:hypothetical protein|nr:hypothetical protein [Clostridiales bacterium]